MKKINFLSSIGDKKNKAWKSLYFLVLILPMTLILYFSVSGFAHTVDFNVVPVPPTWNTFQFIGVAACT